MIANRRPSQTGMTLVELVMVSAILLSLTGVVYASFRAETHTFNRQSAKAMTQGNLRFWVDRMVADIRRANYDPTNSGTFTFQSFSETDLTFTADFDSDGVLDTAPLETIGYRLNGGSLQTCRGASAGSCTAWHTVLTGVTTSQLFAYVDPQGTVLDCVSTNTNSCATSERRTIAVVNVMLSAEPSTSGIPGVERPVISATASAALRNSVL